MPERCLHRPADRVVLIAFGVIAFLGWRAVVSVPIESSMAGLPDVQQIRSVILHGC